MGQEVQTVNEAGGRHRSERANGPDGRLTALSSGAGAASILQRLRRRHVAIAMTAAVLSLLLHLALLRLFPGFTVYGFVRQQLRERQTPLRLKEVELQPARLETGKRPTRYQPEAARGTLAGDVQGEAVSFRRTTDEGIMEPRMAGAGTLVGDLKSLAEPPPQTRVTWEPRTEILQIQDRVVRDEVSALPRRFTPAVVRSGGRDIAMPADRYDPSVAATALAPEGGSGDPADFTWGHPVAGGGRGGGTPPPPKEEPLAREPVRLTGERPEQITRLRPLERLLKVEAQTYRALTDARYAYCRIEIKRLGPDVLPVLPKDMLFVQDGSASVTEQKLHFCRDGLLRALAQLNPNDRFNVVEFRDEVKRCFPDWAPVTTANVQMAQAFIGAMQSTGNTDIYGSLRELLDLPRVPGRPVTLLMASDGVATVGLTDRSLIIETFSRTNAGAVSVFTLGTYKGANAYLLDLLSYRNRGDALIVTSGRWDIPDALEQRAREISRPVLGDVQFRFANQSACEAYPRLTSNLYLDRPLVLYGRYPRDATRLVFQVTGRAGAVPCDMVFSIDLQTVPEGSREIRTQWAWQKVYDLIGRHASTDDPATLEEIRRTGKVFGLRIPYRNELGD
jgi:hypothetical protein